MTTASVNAQKLDDLSMLLGEMRGAIENLKVYVHEFRHDEKNRQHVEQDFQDRLLRQFEKLREDIQADRLKERAEVAAQRIADRAADSAALEKLREDLAATSADVAALKSSNVRREGAIGAIQWLFKSPLVAWIAATTLALWATMTGRIHP